MIDPSLLFLNEYQTNLALFWKNKKQILGKANQLLCLYIMIKVKYSSIIINIKTFTFLRNKL